jgi:hypothetical protein
LLYIAAVPRLQSDPGAVATVAVLRCCVPLLNGRTQLHGRLGPAMQRDECGVDGTHDPC